MDEARIVAEGSPRELIERYVTREVVEIRFDRDSDPHEAAPKSPDEQREMEEAERAGRSRSKGGKERDMNLEPEPKTPRQ